MNLISTVNFRKWSKSSLKWTKGSNLFSEKACYWLYLLVSITYQCRHTVINPFKNYSGNISCYAFLEDVQDSKYYETNLEAGLFPNLNSQMD